ncbi:YdbL family protein [Novosphingobium sp. MW5]|nr:YdbL family protein [Novosphingobium sp. MW5]
MTPRNKVLRSTFAALAATLLLTSVSAQAQRDPAYSAARAAGQVGEKVDGYLGMVGSQGPEIKKLVDDINIKRKAVYFAKAQEKRVTPDEYAFTTGCINMGNLAAGEKYQAPDGSWQTKGAGPAITHSSCP